MVIRDSEDSRDREARGSLYSQADSRKTVLQRRHLEGRGRGGGRPGPGGRLELELELQLKAT